jgi:hypothetical protein
MTVSALFAAVPHPDNHQLSTGESVADDVLAEAKLNRPFAPLTVAHDAPNSWVPGELRDRVEYLSERPICSVSVSFGEEVVQSIEVS